MKQMEFRVSILVSVPEGDEDKVGDILHRYVVDRRETLDQTVSSASKASVITEAHTVYKPEGVLATFTLQQAGWH